MTSLTRRAGKWLSVGCGFVRAVPTSQYPHLCYPEMYVLKGGYKSLVSSHPHLCRPGPASSGEPRSRYTKMLDPMWSEQYQRAQADYLQAWKRLTKRDKGCVHTPSPPLWVVFCACASVS